MLEITIDLNQFGLGINTKTLATIQIINDGTGTLTRGNYKYIITIAGVEFFKGKIKNHLRQEEPVCRLLQKVLNDAYK